jgi:hypothetical protein
LQENGRNRNNFEIHAKMVIKEGLVKHKQEATIGLNP